MRWLVEQFIERPLAAFVSSIEILSEGLQRGQTIDGLVSRIIHTLSCPSGRGSEPEDVVTNGDRKSERQ
jgi:hypothetical protein